MKASCISRNVNPEKDIYVSGNGKPEKRFIFQVTEIVIFQETELSYISGKAYSEPWHI